MNEVVIVAGARTPIGSFNGTLSGFTAPQLGSIVIKEAVGRANIEPAAIDEVIMGCVLQGGLGQAPARQASLGAGMPESVSCLTINKVCSSGLKSAMIGAQMIIAGDADIVVAGGMESMTNTPYYLDKARKGYRMGDGKIIDGMIYDGLWDPYGNTHMGNIAELCSREYKITREQQDEYAKHSYEKAIEAIDKGYFKEQIVPAMITDKRGNSTTVTEDEEPKKVNFEKAGKL
jgi:acetyl-CoA C-acetyltransferase